MQRTRNQWKFQAMCLKRDEEMKFVVLQTLILTQVCRNDLFLPSTPSATSINCSGISIESVDKNTIDNTLLKPEIQTNS